MHAEISALFYNDQDLLADFSVFLPDVPGAPSTISSNTSGMISLGQAATEPPPGRRPAQTAVRARPADDVAGQPPAKKKRSGLAGQPLMESAIASTSAAAKAKPKRRANGELDNAARPTANGHQTQTSEIAAPPQTARIGVAAPPGWQQYPGLYEQAAPAQAVPAPAPAPAAAPPPLVHQTTATQEELTFFDGVSHYLDDGPTYHEFLKLLNLFTQDVIDLPTLVSRAQLFIGSQEALFADFKTMVGWQDGTAYRGGRIENGQWIIENVPVATYDHVKPLLESAKTCGPSYRKLPDSVSLKESVC